MLHVWKGGECRFTWALRSVHPPVRQSSTLWKSPVCLLKWSLAHWPSDWESYPDWKQQKKARAGAGSSQGNPQGLSVIGYPADNYSHFPQRDGSDLSLLSVSFICFTLTYSTSLLCKATIQTLKLSFSRLLWPASHRAREECSGGRWGGYVFGKDRGKGAEFPVYSVLQHSCSMIREKGAICFKWWSRHLVWGIYWT